MRLSILLAFLALTPSLVFSQEGESSCYFQLGFGTASRADSAGFTQDINHEDGYSASTLLGRRFQPFESSRLGLGLEFEASFANNEIKSDGLLNAGSSGLDDLSSLTFLVGGVLEWQLADNVYLYAGGAVGWASNVELNSLGDGPSGASGEPREFRLEDESGSAFQAKLGLRYELGGDSNFSWLFGLRFLTIEDLTVTDSDLGQSFDLENEVIALEISVRWGL